MAKFIRKMQNMENGIFDGVGKYNIPFIKPFPKEEFEEDTQWIDFHMATKSRTERGKIGVHFFVDDYQFERCWTSLNVYTRLLEQYKYVTSPDFSQYLDMPIAIRIYNHFRKHYLGAYWQSKGLKVIPTLGWTDVGSYDYCFDGEPKKSVVAISTQGNIKFPDLKQCFVSGYNELRNRLDPSLILIYGQLPPKEWGLDLSDTLAIPPFYEQTKARAKLRKNIIKLFK